MTLHYTENGIKATVGYVQIVPWPLSRTGASNKIHTTVDLAQSHTHDILLNLSNVTDISAPSVCGDSNAPALNVLIELQGLLLRYQGSSSLSARL